MDSMTDVTNKIAENLVDYGLITDEQKYNIWSSILNAFDDIEKNHNVKIKIEENSKCFT